MTGEMVSSCHSRRNVSEEKDELKRFICLHLMNCGKRRTIAEFIFGIFGKC